MTKHTYAMGDRVLASHSGTGLARAGVVVGVITGHLPSILWGAESKYMVRFDGEGGLTGPCVVIRAEGEREAVSPASETGS